MAGVLGRDAVRELDRRAIEEYGIPSIVLMENAGRAAADVALLELGDDRRGPVVVLAGPGNNGGDGLVVARTLVNRGVEAEVLAIFPEERLAAASEDVRINAALWRGLGREIRFEPEPELLAERLSAATLVVDGLFGTGLRRPLAAPYPAVVEAVGASGARVLALDLPSGLDADSGAVLGAAVEADVTVTFVAAKPGFHRGEGPARCGRVVVAEIGIPRSWLR